MGKKGKKKVKGADKTQMKTDKKLAAKQSKLLAQIGEAPIQDIIAKLEAEQNRLTQVIETVTAAPSARSCFTLCAHPLKEELIMFGGEFYNGHKTCVYSDLYFYNISKNEWRLLKPPAGPAPRSSHQMIALSSDGGQLWLFGGEHASPSQLQFYHFKDLWVFRLDSKKWEKVNAPNGPSARSGHRMAATKKKIVVFGGFHDNNTSYQYFNDVHIFSIDSYTWIEIEVGGVMPPSPRSGCCMIANTDGRILIWGGYTKIKMNKDSDRGVTHNDMFVLVPDKSKPETKFKWVSVKPGGFKLQPCSGVACTTAPNGRAYCFGGVMDVNEDEENINSQFSNTLYSLDLATTTFHLVELSQKERAKTESETENQEVEMSDQSTIATATTVSEDGVLTVKLDGSSSSEAKISSLFDKIRPKSVCGPHPRMNAGMAVCKGKLYLFGGIYEEDKKQCTLCDFYSLKLHKLDEWETIIPCNMSSQEWADSGSDVSDGGDSSDESNDESDEDSEESDSQMQVD